MVSGTTLSPKGDQTDDAVIRAQALRPLVAASPFSQEFYLGQYPDLLKASASGRLPDPHRHFIEHGYFEGRFGHPDDLWLA